MSLRISSYIGVGCTLTRKSVIQKIPSKVISKSNSVALRTVGKHTPSRFPTRFRFYSTQSIHALRLSKLSLPLTLLGGITFIGVGIAKTFCAENLNAETKVDLTNVKIKTAEAPVTINIKNDFKSTKSLTLLPEPNENFVRRDDVSDTIDSALGEGKICYLKGFGGFGKTQLALNFAQENADRYSHIVFINCENFSTLTESIATIANCLEEKKGVCEDSKRRVENFVDKENPYWKKQKKPILIIIDNVDNGKVYREVAPFLRKEVAGHILVTGRWDIPDVGNLRQVEISEVSFQQAREIFRRSLGNAPVSREFFDESHQVKTNEFLMKTLGGIPLAIQLAAHYIKINRPRHPNKAMAPFKTTTGMNVTKQMLLTENGAEVGYQKSIVGATDPHLRAIAEDCPEPLRNAFYDFVFFLAFMSPNQCFTLDVNPELISVLKKHSKSHEDYKGDITVFIKNCLHKLNRTTLITSKHKENDTYTIDLRLTVKWAIIYRFLLEHEELRKAAERAITTKRTAVENEWSWDWFWDWTSLSTLEHYTQNQYYTLDGERYRWFFAGLEFQRKMEDLDPYFFSYFCDFITGYMKKSSWRAAELISSLEKPFRQFVDRIEAAGTAPEFFSRIDELELESLENILELALKSGVEERQVLRAQLALFELYLEKNLDKCEEILQMHQIQKFPLYFVKRGRFYSHKAQKTQNQDRLKVYLEKSRKAYADHLKRYPHDSNAHNNLAIACYRLFDLTRNEDFFNKADEHYGKAIRLGPFVPLFEENYSLLFSTAQRSDEAKRHQEIARVLRLEEFSTLSKSYRAQIAKFLRSQGDFELRDGPFSSVMEDRGVYLGNVINSNPRVKTMTLYGCHLNDVAVEAIAKSLHTNNTITSLALEYNSEVTDRGVLAFIDVLKKEESPLQKLSFKWNRTITGESAIALVAAAKPKFELVLTGCSGIHNRHEIQQLANQREVKVIFEEQE